jgi:hypothetical protein
LAVNANLADVSRFTFTGQRAFMTTTPINEAMPKASLLKLAAMGFLTLWCPYVFVWFIQGPEYPTAFRRWFTGWAIFWCICAILFFIVNLVTGDQHS